MDQQLDKESPQFKAKVALEALTGTRNIEELSQIYQIPPTTIIDWKEHIFANSSNLFEGNSSPACQSYDVPYFNDTYEETRQLAKHKAAQDAAIHHILSHKTKSPTQIGEQHALNIIAEVLAELRDHNEILKVILRVVSEYT